jgi:hypothetical protein
MAGPVLYLVGHLLFELRMTRAVPRTRLAAAIALVVISPLGLVLPVLVTWTLVYGTLAVVAAVETHARLWGRAGGVPRRGWLLPVGPRRGTVLRERDEPVRAGD